MSSATATARIVVQATPAEKRSIAAKKLLSSGVPPRDVAKDLGVSVPTLYRWIPASASA